MSLLLIKLPTIGERFIIIGIVGISAGISLINYTNNKELGKIIIEISSVILIFGLIDFFYKRIKI